MNFDLSFLPEIEEDVFTGFLWYENKAVGLGDNFLQLFYEKISLCNLLQNRNEQNYCGWSISYSSKSPDSKITAFKSIIDII